MRLICQPWLFALVAGLCPCIASEVGATESAEPPGSGIHEHDGFMFRHLDLGIGVIWVDVGDPWPALSGENSLGWIAAPRLALHVSGWLVAPLYGGWGLGATYYPDVFQGYVSVMAGVPTVILDSETSGLAVRADVGREWWVSDNWGIGVAFTADYIQFGWDQFLESSTLLWPLILSVAFSATYN
jgi:hypothetical protein